MRVCLQYVAYDFPFYCSSTFRAERKMAKSFNTSSNAMSKEFTKWYYKGFTVRKISRKCCSKIWYVHYKDYKQITYNG